MSSHDDGRDILLMRALSGDTDSYVRLIAYYQDNAYRMALLMLADSQEAQKVAAEAFVLAFSLLPEYRIGTPFECWLLGILYKRIKRELQTKKRNHINFPDIGLQDDLKMFLVQSVKKLPSDERVLIVLRYLFGFSAKEVAKIVDLQEASVVKKLMHARQRLAVAESSLKEQSPRKPDCPDNEEIDKFVENPQDYSAISNHLYGCEECMEMYRFYQKQRSAVAEMLIYIPVAAGMPEMIESMFAEVEKDSNILSVIVTIAIIAGAMLLGWIFVSMLFLGSQRGFSIVEVGGVITSLGGFAADMSWVVDDFHSVGNFFMFIPVVIFTAVLFYGNNRNGGLIDDEKDV